MICAGREKIIDKHAKTGGSQLSKNYPFEIFEEKASKKLQKNYLNLSISTIKVRTMESQKSFGRPANEMSAESRKLEDRSPFPQINFNKFRYGKSTLDEF